MSKQWVRPLVAAQPPGLAGGVDVLSHWRHGDPVAAAFICSTVYNKRPEGLPLSGWERGLA